MNVKNVIELACTYLQLTDVLNCELYGGNISKTDVEKDVDLLTVSVNLVNSIIASEYIKLYKTVSLNSENGKIEYNKISSKDKILEIISVKNKFGNKLIFMPFAEYIKTLKGEIEITYTYAPEMLSFTDKMNIYGTKITDRVLAYGVASEFCFIKGMYDDATMWDLRFKNSLAIAARKKSDTTIKPRRWA